MYWLDILLILGVGAFVASRFFSFKLPKDDTPKAQRRGWQEVLDKLQPPNPNQAADARQAAGAAKPTPKPKGKSNAKGLDAVKEADPSFEEARFLDGTAKAYTYFYERYNALDLEGLDNLCGPQLMAELTTELEEHEENGTTPQIVVESLTDAKIKDARLTGRTAIVTVSLTATHREGPRGAAKTVKQNWVFARALTSGDPNWELQSISRGADA